MEFLQTIRRTVLPCLSLLFFVPLSGQSSPDGKQEQPADMDSLHVIQDMEGMAELDGLFIPQAPDIEYLEGWNPDSIGFDRNTIRTIPDSVFIVRLHEMDGQTPFRLDFNRHVRSAINGYLGRNAHVTAKSLGLAEMYFPLFEEILDREGLPLELKYLAIVESALNPNARSRAGATGLWQFMYHTAKENGLTITSYLDERRDPLKSTEAACQYLKSLHERYNDWNLALAAYNSGPGNVNKAIRRAGGKKDYWKIWSHLPRETRGYVPAFIAVNYAMTHSEDHGIRPLRPHLRYFDTDTMQVEGPINFTQIMTFTGTDLDLLRALNPQYRRGYIPNMGRKMSLRLPREDVGAFVMNQEQIRAYEPPVLTVEDSSPKRVPQDPFSTEGKVKTSYTVRSGDVLGVIAERYGVGVSKLRYWNGLKGSRIYPGQRLAIYTNPGQKTTTQSARVKKQAEQVLDPNARYHTIRDGDTLWDIAQMYDGVTLNQIKQWNAHLDFKRLKPGQKIRISG